MDLLNTTTINSLKGGLFELRVLSQWLLNEEIQPLFLNSFLDTKEKNINLFHKERFAKFVIVCQLSTKDLVVLLDLSCSCTPGSWAQHTGEAQSVSGLDDYIASLYWAAATMSSTGYGDIHAHNTEESAYCHSGHAHWSFAVWILP